MNLSIKYASIADAPLLAKIASGTFFDTYRGTHLMSDLEAFVNEYYSLKATEADLLNDTTHYLILFEKEHVAGYARLSKAASPEFPERARNPLEIARIYLGKEFKGRGLGKYLMDACIDHAKVHKHDAIWLAVWEHNTKAIEFYFRCGFREYGETTFPLKSTIDRDLLMVKYL